MKKIVWSLLIGVLVLNAAYADPVYLEAGDTQALISAIEKANADGEDWLEIYIIDGPDNEHAFEFSQAYAGTKNALPVITKTLSIIDNRTVKDEPITFLGSGNRDFRLLTVEADGEFSLLSGGPSTPDIEVKDFGVNGESGGAILANGNAKVRIVNARFKNNYSDRDGGAIACIENASIQVSNALFEGNRASNLGGAISIIGLGGAFLSSRKGGSIFRDNQAGVYGCDLNINTSGETRIVSTVFEGGNCPNVLIENPFGNITFAQNTVEHGDNAIDSTSRVRLFGNMFNGPSPPNQVRASAGHASKPQAACNDFGSGAFVSDGYNISTEDSCSLDQDTDQPNTDPMLSLNDNNLPVLDAGSPAIDAGSAEVIVPDNEGLASLPCSYVDINGVARPQDGNGDGEFECDPGVSEFVGAGMVEAGHSGAFFNGLRNGEGTYVEVLNDSLAVVYTFTYRPDGSGPSWFVGVGDIRDNGIVIDELLRPIGTSFGDSFDPEAVDFSDAGGMSMVFPDCYAGVTGGSVAYSGHEDSGYEGVLTRAQRLTSITGCTTVPTANVGLSGSFFDPARNGEGLIIEWLDNGDVLAVFFTFDLNGDQFWTFGIGTPNGKSVTIEALYPSQYTSWGRDFNADEVVLESWGTFNLGWTDCDNLGFSYSSTVSGYGSASRDYTRISSLQGASCPDF